MEKHRYDSQLNYIYNTGGGSTVAHFIEDWEPIGKRIWDELLREKLVRIDDEGCIFLTDIGLVTLKGNRRTSIVAVQFQNRKSPEEFSGREYTYFSNVPLEVGDVILAPAKNGASVVRVCRTDMAESEIDESVIPFMKTIEELVRPEDLEV